jgi:hypothetical protein
VKKVDVIFSVSVGAAIAPRLETEIDQILEDLALDIAARIDTGSQLSDEGS